MRRPPLPVVLVALAALAAASTLSLRASAGDGVIKLEGELLKKAKLTLAKAVEEALKACPGQAVAARLTTDDDGAPIFRVTVHKGDSASNVWVDAVGGKAKIQDTWKDDEEAPKSE